MDFREFVCTNLECPLEGKVQLFEDGKAEYWCESCHQTLKIIPEVTPEGIRISVRDANALRHFLMREFIPYSRYRIVIKLLHKIDEQLSNMGIPYDKSTIDTEDPGRYDKDGRDITKYPPK